MNNIEATTQTAPLSARTVRGRSGVSTTYRPNPKEQQDFLAGYTMLLSLFEWEDWFLDCIQDDWAWIEEAKNHGDYEAANRYFDYMKGHEQALANQRNIVWSTGTIQRLILDAIQVTNPGRFGDTLIEIFKLDNSTRAELYKNHYFYWDNHEAEQRRLIWP